MNLKTSDESQAIKIETGAFKHLFLMTAANMGGLHNTQGPFSFESKVVYFTPGDGNYINLFEQTDRPDSGIEDAKLLASFPIIEKNEDYVVFDFDHGMKRIYQKRNTLSYNNHLNQEHTFDIVESFLYQAQVIDQHLIIKHHVNIKQTNPSGNVIYDQVNMKYTFASYMKSPTFVEKTHPDRSLYAFYETHAKKQNSKVIRLNHTGPITFYYTGNIPPEYFKAVMDGIKYWNNLLGVDFIEIKKLPKGSEAFDPGVHIIEWSNEERNYAYTSMQNDPLTGEILQTYINFPNPLNSPQYQLIGEFLKKHTRKVMNSKNSNATLSIKQFNPTMIIHNETVNELQTKQSTFNDLLQTIPNQWQTESISKRIFSDLISSLIAHEVGHALGIKHNFAGSVESTLSISDKKAVYYNYIFYDQLDPNLVTTSSIMDYLPFTFLALTGAQIRKQQLHFSWDQLMLGWLYPDQADATVIHQPIFCSDQDHDQKKWINCRSFDAFKNPISGSISTFDDHLKILAFEIAQNILDLGRQTLHLLPPTKLSSLLGARRTGQELFQSYQAIMDNLSSEVKFIQTDDTRGVQQTSLGEAHLTLADILITPVSINHQSMSNLILALKQMVIGQIIFITKENVRDLGFVPKLDLYFYDIEEVFLNYYFTYLTNASFYALFANSNEELAFFNSMDKMIESNLFSSGIHPIDLSYRYFYPKLYHMDGSFNDTRRLIINFLFHNTFIDRADLLTYQSNLRSNTYQRLLEHINALENQEVSPADPFRFNEYLQSEYQLLEILKNGI